jgi:hypothetical protein
MFRRNIISNLPKYIKIPLKSHWPCYSVLIVHVLGIYPLLVDIKLVKGNELVLRSKTRKGNDAGVRQSGLAYQTLALIQSFNLTSPFFQHSPQCLW